MSQSFTFEGIDNNLKNGSISFTYRLSTTGNSYFFTETLTLPKPVTREVPEPVLSSILQMLHLMLGISYWKLYCPKDIIINRYTLKPSQAYFFNTLYTQGLGEFYFKNNIDFRGLVSFPSDTSLESRPTKLRQNKRSLVGLGGGKDSIVVAEMLKSQNRAFDTYVVETQHHYPLIDTISSKLGKQTLMIKRMLDPQLMKLSKQPDTYNGHIPISAVYGAIGVLLCVVYDYASVLVGNERSSSIGNTNYLGEEINHQWSKSQTFETLFQTFIHDTISPQLNYLSLLRPLSEMQIMELFIKSPDYLSLFSSCNRNFSITHQLTHSKWCGECPKCAFVFALLAAFVSKETAISTVGKNLFAQKSLLSTYQELWGEKGVKPFECVGTPKEVTEALSRALNKGEYKDDVIMKYFYEYIKSS